MPELYMNMDQAGAARATWLVGTIAEFKYVAARTGRTERQIAAEWLDSLITTVEKALEA